MNKKSEIFITGDTHGTFNRFSSRNWPEGKTLTKDDYLIIVGDIGLIWSNDPDNREEAYNKKWFDSKPFTTLFIDGNHENHPRLKSFPDQELLGGTVKRVSDSIYYLLRGEVYTINNKKFFCMGGATSVDKVWRTEGISWWADELPSCAEYESGLNNLEKHDWKVDYVLTHTMPLKVFNDFGIEPIMEEGPKGCPVANYLDMISEELTFKRWFFGHFHKNQTAGKFTCMHENIRPLEYS